TFRDEPAGRLAAPPHPARRRSRDRAAAWPRAPLPPRSRTARPGAGLDRPLRAVLGRPAPTSPGTPIQEGQEGTKTIRPELLIPQPREQVWRALTESATLAEWMFPNDFAPRVGHRFTFQVPPKPAVGFDGLVVRCEVLECVPPSRLAFSWSAGGLADTRVSFR